jgi:outer membrane protein assembly factor BamD
MTNHTGLRTIISFVVLALLAASLTGGCATTKPPQFEGPPESEAEALFRRAERRLHRSDYEGAVEAYNDIRNRHPYSSYATRADLRIGDAYFQQESFGASIEAYKGFVQLHPKHDKVDYARFRVARAYYEQMPNSMFFMPPAHQRDLTQTKKAVGELKSFLRQHKDSKYSERADKLLAQARRRLADHELYVARFYYQRDNPGAAANRTQYLLNNYSGLGLDPDALLLMAKSYLELGKRQQAAVALKDILNVHPDSPQARTARTYIDRYNLSSTSEANDDDSSASSG